MSIFKDFNEERSVLGELGWNDDQIKKWSLQDDGQVVPRTQHSPIATGLASALRGAPAAAVGTVAGILGSAAASPVVGIPAGIGAGVATDIGVEKIIPKAAQYYLQESAFQNPKSAFTGSLGSALAGGFRPSPTFLKGAVSGLPRIFNSAAIADPARQAAQQLLVQTGIGAALPYGSSAVKEVLDPSSKEGVLSRVGKSAANVSLGDVLSSAGTMALANRPYKFLNRAAPKIFPDITPALKEQESSRQVSQDIKAGRTSQYKPEYPEEGGTDTPGMTPVPKVEDIFSEDNPFMRTVPSERLKKGTVTVIQKPVMTDREVLRYAKKAGLIPESGEVDIADLRKELGNIFEEQRLSAGRESGEVPDQPSAEPIKDLNAQVADLKDPNNPRKGVFLSKDNVDRLKAEFKLQELTKGLHPLQRPEGLLLFATPEDRAAAMQAYTIGKSNQEVVGELTGAGTGKPLGAETIVQQKTPEGAVTKETLVRPEEATSRAEEFKVPGRNVETIPVDEAILRRQKEIREEQAKTAYTQEALLREKPTGEFDASREGLDPEAVKRQEGQITQHDLDTLEDTLAKRQITGKGAEPVKVEGLPLEKSGFKDYQPLDQPLNAPTTAPDEGIQGAFAELARRRGLKAETVKGPIETPEGQKAGMYESEPHKVTISDKAAETGPHEVSHPVIKNWLATLSESRLAKLNDLFAKDGLTLEEALATGTGRDVVKRIAKKDFGAFRSLMAGLKDVFGKSNEYDILRNLGDATVEGGNIPKPETARPVVENQFISKVPKDDERIRAAYKMQIEGATPYEIMGQLGVFKKEDGVWREYIDMTKNPEDYFHPDFLSPGKVNAIVKNTLSAHGLEVLNRLPDGVRDKVLAARIITDPAVKTAHYAAGDNSIHVNPRYTGLDRAESFVHEIQHAIQEHQGMLGGSRGSSIEYEKTGGINYKVNQDVALKMALEGKGKPVKAVDRIRYNQEYKKRVIQEGNRKDPTQEYMNNLGEREARKASEEPRWLWPAEGEVDIPGQIDYQPFGGAVDTIRDKKVSDNIRKAYEERALLTGKLIDISRPLKKFDPAAVQRVANLHNDVYFGHITPPTLTGEELQISNILKKYARDTEAEKVKVGLGAKKANEWYIPNMLSREAIDVIKTGDSGQDALKTAMEGEMVRNGSTPADAKQQVNDYINGIQSSEGKVSTDFGALHKAAGYGLPEKVTLPDGRTINVRDAFPYERYARRASSDIKWQEHVRKNYQRADLMRDPAYRDVQRDYFGGFEQFGGLPRAFNRLAGSLQLQLWTAAKDFATTPQSARREGFSWTDIASGLMNIVKGRQSAISKDLIRDEPYLIGANPRTGTRTERWVNNAADFIYKLSGRKFGDDWGRAWAQAIADKSGRPEAAQYIAGIYDARELPTWMLKPGLLGEALRINRWNVSTANRLIKGGKVNPLRVAEAALLAMGIGAGFDKLREKWSGLIKARPELDDLKAGNADTKHYVSWATDLLQKGSFAGMYGDIVNAMVQGYVRGDTKRAQAFIPGLEAVRTITGRFNDALRAALDEGQDAPKAVGAAVNETARNLIQNYRLIYDKLQDEQTKTRKNENRDLNVFREVQEGMRPGNFEESNVSEGAAERQFKQEMDPAKAAEQLQPIIQRYQQVYREKPEVFLKKLAGLKKNKTAVPADMQELAAYYNFLSVRDGEQKAQNQIKDLMNRKEINQLKSGMVP